MRLAELQAAFQGRLLHGSADIDPLVVGDERLAAAERLGIYEHAYVSRLAEALGETYAAVRYALGEARFAQLAALYVREHPSNQFSIRFYGAEFAAFVTRSRPQVRAAVLADLARWEWTLAATFDGPDVPPLAVESLSGLASEDWPDLRFEFTPTMSRVRTTTNAHSWWRAATDGAPRPTRWRMARPTEWLVWRQGLATRFRSLPPDETWALDAALNGHPFSSLCEGLVQFGDEAQAPLRAAMLLRGWVSEGLLVAANAGRSG